MPVYHLARTELYPNQHLDSYEPILDFRGDLVDFRKSFSDYIPSKLSRFGEDFLLGRHEYSKDTAFTEYLFEFVRIQKFSNNTSRFQCLFGSKSIEDASKWLNRLNNNKPNHISCTWKLWEVETDSFSEHDATWLDLASQNHFSLPVALQCAENYWNGNMLPNNSMPELLLDLPVKITSLIKETM